MTLQAAFRIINVILTIHGQLDPYHNSMHRDSSIKPNTAMAGKWFD